MLAARLSVLCDAVSCFCSMAEHMSLPTGMIVLEGGLKNARLLCQRDAILVLRDRIVCHNVARTFNFMGMQMPRGLCNILSCSQCGRAIHNPEYCTLHINNSSLPIVN